MRGIPRNIQTPADLDNLFQQYAAGKQVRLKGKAKLSPAIADLMMTLDENLPEESKIDGNELTGCIRRLLGRQYHRVRILEIEGNKLTTMHFPEITHANRTEEGHEIVTYEHIEASEDSESTMEAGEGTVYETTILTLSAAPSDTEWLSVYMPDNHLTRMGFNVAKIQEMLEVLTNA